MCLEIEHTHAQCLPTSAGFVRTAMHFPSLQNWIIWQNMPLFLSVLVCIAASPDCCWYCHCALLEKKPEWCAWNKKVMHFNSLFIVCYRLQECVLRQLFPLYIDDDEETAFQTRRKNGNFSHNNVCLFHFFKSRRHALLFSSFKSLAQCLFLRGFP